MFAEPTSLRAVKSYSVRNIVAAGGYSRSGPTMLAVPASPVSPALAAEIALRHYGVVAAAERLASEFDDTFRLAGGDGSRWLLKVGAEAADGAPVADGAGFQTALLLHLAAVAPSPPVPGGGAGVERRPAGGLAGRAGGG